MGLAENGSADPDFRWLGGLGNNQDDLNSENCALKPLVRTTHGTDDLGATRGEDGPMLTEEQWGVLLEASGFNGLDGALQDYPEHPEQAASVMFATASLPQPENPRLEIIIAGQGVPGTLSRNQLQSPLEALGTIIWIDFSDLADMNLSSKYCILLDDPAHQYLTTMTAASFRGLQRLTQAQGILWVSGGSKLPNTGLVKGLTRVLGSENPNTSFVTLSIDDWTSPRRALADIIAKVFEHSFLEYFRQTEYDEELEERDGVLYIPRLVHDTLMDEAFKLETGVKHGLTLQPFSQGPRPLKMTINNPGFLDTLCFVDDERAAEPLLEDEIEIDIKASGLNFKDVILGLGQLAGNHLGQECSGVVTRVGVKVSHIKCNDRVCAITEVCALGVQIPSFDSNFASWNSLWLSPATTFRAPDVLLLNARLIAKSSSRVRLPISDGARLHVPSQYLIKCHTSKVPQFQSFTVQPSTACRMWPACSLTKQF